MWSVDQRQRFITSIGGSDQGKRVSAGIKSLDIKILATHP
jgi:hypothetical protein